MINREKLKVVIVAFVLLLLGIFTCLLCTGCREADRVNYNLSKEADNFNIVRKLTVMNARTDTIMLELTGRFALNNNSTQELVVTIEYEKGLYKKNYIYLTENVLYVVEDLSGADVSPYQYELTFLPDTIPLAKFDVDFDEAEVR